MTDEELRETIDPVRDLSCCFKHSYSQLNLTDSPCNGLTSLAPVAAPKDNITLSSLIVAALRGEQDSRTHWAESVQVYQAFLDGSIHVPGKDLCDMSGASGRTREEYTVYNVMLPRRYHPQWQGNLFERRCKVCSALSSMSRSSSAALH